MIPPPSMQVFDGRRRQVVGSRADDGYCHCRARVRFKCITIANSKAIHPGLELWQTKNRPGSVPSESGVSHNARERTEGLMVTRTDRRSIRTFGALRSAPSAVLAAAAMALAACSGNGNSATQSTAPLQAQNTQLSQAASSSVQVTGSQPGVTPFIGFVELIGTGMQNVAAAGDCRVSGPERHL